MTILYEIKTTETFNKQLKSLTKNEQRAVYNKLNIMVQNPYHPSLRTKKYKGTIDLFEMSVNKDIRILWRYEGNKIILMLEVGHHKNVLGV